MLHVYKIRGQVFVHVDACTLYVLLQDGQTPLLLAVRKQDTDMVQEILGAANNVNVDYIAKV